MKKMMLVFAQVIIVLLCSVSFAEGNGAGNNIVEVPFCAAGTTQIIDIGNAEYIRTSDGQMLKVDDLLCFATQAEADEYINGLKDKLRTPVDHAATISFNARATYGDALVSSITYNYLNTLALRVEYTTSGDANTGVVTYHKAYTTFTGFTLGIAWNEITCNSQITSSGKDIYATAHGELAYYILIENLLELGREAVSLSGYCTAVR